MGVRSQHNPKEGLVHIILQFVPDVCIHLFHYMLDSVLIVINDFRYTVVNVRKSSTKFVMLPCFSAKSQ